MREDGGVQNNNLGIGVPALVLVNNMKRAYAPVFVALVIILIVYFLGLIIHALHSGSFPRYPGPPIYRADNPGWFWFDILLCAIGAMWGAGVLYFDWRKRP